MIWRNKNECSQKPGKAGALGKTTNFIIGTERRSVNDYKKFYGSSPH
nr:MAG TPA: hypothetical protein [Caudoviricetes sp.]